MSEDAGAVDVFQAGGAVWAVPRGVLLRVAKGDLPRCGPGGGAIRLSELGGRPRIVFPRGPGVVGGLLVEVSAGGREMTLEVDGLLGVGVKPLENCPADDSITRFCGLSFVRGILVLEGGLAIEIRLDALYDRLHTQEE